MHKSYRTPANQSGFSMGEVFIVMLLAVGALLGAIATFPGAGKPKDQVIKQLQASRVRISPLVVETELESMTGPCARLNEPSNSKRDQRLVNRVDGQPVCGYRLEVTWAGTSFASTEPLSFRRIDQIAAEVSTGADLPAVVSNATGMLHAVRVAGYEIAMERAH